MIWIFSLNLLDPDMFALLSTEAIAILFNCYFMVNSLFTKEKSNILYILSDHSSADLFHTPVKIWNLLFWISEATIIGSGTYF